MSSDSGDTTHRHTVAQHYNKLEQKAIHERKESRILHLRNFNNWVKSVSISEALDQLRRDDPRRRIEVLDLCCGKGGDLRKWSVGRVDKVVMVDIAEISVQQAQERYDEMRSIPRFRGKVFDAEFHVADCGEAVLSELYRNPNQQFDLVSCQFSLHYNFESYERAKMIVRNALERLRPGGIFIGTIPDSHEILKRLEEAEHLTFGNNLYAVTFDSKDSRPLFGDRYHFFLEEAVDCPEFLVYFPLLEEMAKEYGATLDKRRWTFKDFHRTFYRGAHKELAERLGVFESYPSDELLGDYDEGDYDDAEDKVRELRNDSRNARDPRVGTISKSEWEVCSMYCAFEFHKKGSNQSSPNQSSRARETQQDQRRDKQSRSSPSSDQAGPSESHKRKRTY